MISSIIVNYHSAYDTARAVNSLLPPNQEEEVEIWIIDNSESEEEAQVLRTELGSRCHILVSSKNLGFGRACNQAFEKTQGEWIFLLNPDAYLEPGALTPLRAFMEKNPRCGAAGPLIYWDQGRNFLLPPSISPSPWRELCTFPAGPVRAHLAWLNGLWWRRQSLRVWQAKGPIRQRNLSGGHALLRRSAVQRAGGLFDTRFFLYYEDTDLFLRLRRAGSDLYVVPSAAVVHEFDGCARDRRDWKQKLMHESHTRFMEKHFSTHPVWLLHKRYAGSLVTAARLPEITDLGTIGAPPALAVRLEIRADWLLEWSPGPFFFPAAGCFGKGASAEFSREAWELLPTGRQFVRLSSRKGTWVSPRVWQWNKT
jgi:GT2 family glycosyltransferase